MIVAHTDFDRPEGMLKTVQEKPLSLGENVTELLTILSEINEKVCLIETQLYGEGLRGDTLRPTVDCLDRAIFNGLDAAREINGKLGSILERL